MSKGNTHIHGKGNSKKLRKARANLNARRNAHAATLTYINNTPSCSANPAGYKAPGSMKGRS